MASNLRIKGFPSAGIKNKGNTCFFNSSIQALLSLPELVDYLIQNTFDSSKQIFSSALQNFISQYTASKVADPASLISILRWKIKLFDGKQQDAHSFLESLISRLSDESESMNSAKKSFLKKIFGIQTEDTVKCHECGFKSKGNTLSMIQYLFMKKSIQESVDDYLKKEEQVDASSPWKCTECKQTGVSSLSHDITSTSNYLILFLNRFQSLKTKNSANIIIDYELKINKSTYELIATVCHSGSLSGGHYYSYCKRGGEWNEYNDSLVQSTTMPEQGQQVYMLFYSRINL